MELKEFLRENKIFSLSAIEEKCGFSDGVLRRYVGNGKMSEGRCNEVVSYLKEVISLLDAPTTKPKKKAAPKPSGDWQQVNDIYKYVKKGDYYERDGVLYDKKYVGSCFYVMPLK